MAAIDKMYVKSYYDFNDFVTWCIVNNPKLLYHFYDWRMTEEDWNKWKQEVFNSQLERIEKAHENWSTVKDCLNYYKKNWGYECSKEQAEKEVKEHLEDYSKIHSDNYIDEIELPIANFSCNEDKYLLWHCPFDFVREYLQNQCGYKTRWYHKIFFKR